MNSPFVLDQTRELAARAASSAAADPAARIEALYRDALGRRPTPREIELGLAFLAAEEAPAAAAAAEDPPADKPEAASPPLSPWERYVQVVLLSNEFVYVD